MSKTNDKKERTFEWWMISFVAAGAGWAAFISLLIPPFVTESTGSAADAGTVMAIISLAAVLAPVLGSFADKYRAHRLVLTLGVLGMGLGFLMYSVSAESQAIYVLDAIVLGISAAAINAVGPVFVLGAKLAQDLQAKRLTTLNLLQPVGQVLGGALLAIAVTANLDFSARFTIAAVFMLVCGILTWFTTGEPAKRIVLQEDKPDDQVEDQKKSYGLKSVLLSTFGMTLFILTLSSVGNNGINAQIANILPNVYGMDQQTTSALISLAGLLNIFLFIVAGRWLARSGGMTVLTGGTVVRLVGALGMALVGMMINKPILLAAVFMLILYQSNPFSRISQGVVGMRFATVPAGATSGWVIASSAAGSFIGALLGGYLASTVGFNGINWMSAIAIGIALLLIFVSLWPAERKKRQAEATTA
ncbi:MAG: MFS transporter [Anaerolineae bacterium]|nr:MFS transporter [Anaerolineae bacterium]MCO5192355.1 MFS transporter [Anaerolineae bacterium]MCO5199805.1 MFS transporter [Anaerolineae bacterium]MCO5203835.1 MFS transporter [Anaerolineae bacterium]